MSKDRQDEQNEKRNILEDLRIWIPTLDEHVNRNQHNTLPFYSLKSIGKNQYTDGVDIWYRVPWYLNVFHNTFKNVKFLKLCDSFCSSEILIPRKNIKLENGSDDSIVYVVPLNAIKPGTFNYRDFNRTSHIRHFCADIFPYVLYLKSPNRSR